MMSTYPNEIDILDACVSVCAFMLWSSERFFQKVAPKRSLLIDCSVEPNWMRLALSPPFATITIYQMMHMNVGPKVYIFILKWYGTHAHVYHLQTPRWNWNFMNFIRFIWIGCVYGTYPSVCILLESIFHSICSIQLSSLPFDCQTGCTT